MSHILPNPVILKEARVSSEIENVITTHDKLYQALSATGTQVDHATKEVLRYREAMLAGYLFNPAHPGELIRETIIKKENDM